MNNSLALPDSPCQSAGDLSTASAVKLRVAKIVASATAGRMIGAVTRRQIRHHGLRFDTTSSDFSPWVRAQMFWGTYEGAETRMIRRIMRQSRTVIELGSSLGVTTAHLASALAPGGRLICVEANPRLIPGLRDRVSLFAPYARVEIIHAAITDHCGSAVVVIAPNTLGTRVAGSAPGDGVPVEVPALTLRELVRLTGVTDFDLVSDIEGAETSFLIQDPGVLKKCGRAVIELHSTAISGRSVSVFDLIAAAQDAGFRIVGRQGPVVGLTRPSR